MRALVVYESMYGNTRAVAGSIADGLRADYEVTVVPVAEATAELVAGADLLVAGAADPHARAVQHVVSADGRGSRRQGRQRAATGPGRRRPGHARLAEGPRSRGRPRHRLRHPDHGVPAFTGRASRPIAKLLKRHGYRLVAAPASFLVSSQSTLLDGEADRARRWGMTIAAASKTYLPAHA